MSEPGPTQLAARHHRRIRHHVDGLLERCALPDDLCREARADFIAHIVQEVRAQAERGLELDEALETALVKFGRPEDIRRQLSAVAAGRRRATPVGGMPTARRSASLAALQALNRDLKYGLRNLLRAPALTAVALITIALGVGANTAIFTVLNGVLLRPLPYAETDELVRVWPEKVFSEAMLTEVREQTTSYQGLSVASGTTLTLRGVGAEPRLVRGALVTGDHFSLLGGKPLLGRGIEPADQRTGGEDAVVLSHELWQHDFAADPDIVGRLIDLDGAGLARRRVVGVMSPDFVPLTAGIRFWVPLITDEEARGFNGAYGYRVFGRLRPGVSAGQAAAELRRLVPEFTERHPTQFRQARYSPVDVVPMLETLVADIRPTLLLLGGAVGFVLLIACTNVANLLLARASSRRSEVAIRLSLGASRGRLVRQLLTESVLLGVLGGACGLAAGVAMLAAISRRLPDYVPRAPQIQLDLNVLAFTAAISLLAGILFGVAPALRATSVAPRAMLAEGTRGATGGGRGRRRVNNTLVAIEIALSLVLVVGAGLMVKSFARLSGVDPGFDPDGLVAVQLELPAGYAEAAQREAYFRQLTSRISASGRVVSVGGVNYLPLTRSSAGIPYLVEGQELPEGTSSLVGNYSQVTPGYFAAMGMRLLSGRLLEETDVPEAEQVVVVNQAMVDLHWPEEDPIGKRFVSARNGEPMFTVVGVVDNIHERHLSQQPHPAFYLPATQLGWNLRYLVVRIDGDAASAVADVRAAVREIDPDVIIVDLVTMEAVVRETMGDARFFVGIFSTFAAVAALLGIVGVYGVVSYTTSQRTREIGLRVALGASPERVLRAVVGAALGPVLIGVGAGVLLAFGLTRFLHALLFEVAPTDPGVFALVALTLTLVGVGAALPPARRAAATDPLVAMRTE